MNDTTETESPVEAEASNSVAVKSTGNSKAAKSLATTTFGTLFKPSAELMGQELKEWTANKIAERKRKLVQENTEQAKVMNPEINNAEIKSEKQIENFEKWVEGVGEIEPEDPIAVAWQRILLDITQDNFDTDILLDSLSSLDRSEAAFFAFYVKNDIAKMHPEKRDHYFQRLAGKNILTVEPAYRHLFIRTAGSVFKAFYGREFRMPDRHRLTWVGEALAGYLK